MSLLEHERPTMDRPTTNPGGRTYGCGDLCQAAEAGIRAPSLYNSQYSQPWRFRLRDGAVEVRIDPGRRLDAADRTGWAARPACGAATHNARLARTVAGGPADVHLLPDPTDRDLIACTPSHPTRRREVTEVLSGYHWEGEQR